MIETPYSATPCKGYVLDKVVSALRQLEIDGQLIGEYAPVMFVAPMSVDVPAFTQPITPFDAPSLQSKIILDGRALFRMTGREIKTARPIRQDLLDLTLIRARLQLRWAGNEQVKRDLLNIGAYPAKVYINWVARSIGSRLGMDIAQVMTLSVVAGYWFAQQFGQNTAPKDLERCAVMASRWTHVPTDQVFTLLGELKPLNTLADFVALAKARVEGQRIQELSTAIIYAFLGSNWGSTAKETTAVALEHPPTFYTMLYMGIQDRGMGKMPLSQMAKTLARSNEDREFARSVEHLIASR